MARAKKKKITLEEALVPIEDQPYQVPDNWCWTTLDVVADYKKGPFGSAITKAMFVPKGPDTYKVYEQGNAIRKTIDYGEYYVTAEKFEELKGFKVKPGDLIVSCAGTIGETFQLPDNIEEGVINQALMRVKVSEYIDLKYYLYYFDEMLRQDITGNSKGSAIKNIPPFSVLKKFPYSLPPLAEQRRIVEKIENLFSKLDEAKEKVQDVKESFEKNKVAIFYAAFSGQLTKKWREQNKISFDTWEKMTINDIGEVVTGSTPSKKNPEYFDGSIPFIKPTELNQGKNVCYSAETLTEEGRDVSRPVRKGSTCVCCIGATISKCGLLQVDAVTNQQINTIVPYDFMDDEYVYYYCSSNKFKNKLIESSSATTLPIINKKKMSQLPVIVPLKEEQKEIVKKLDVLLEKEEEASYLASSVIEKIDLMKKSILVKAFRGELGTNNLEEESSIELLKNIIEKQ